MGYPVITISRQYGSGGREIGTQLAQRLGIPFYDKALCTEAARRSGFDESFLEQAERQEGRKFSYLFQSNSYSFCRSLDDQTFLALATTIRDLAEQGPCILVGRGANRILADRSDALHVYLYADRQTRLKRIVAQYGVPAEQAEKVLHDTDRARAVYLKDYTDQIMGQAENYHLCLDSGALGIEHTVKILEAVYRTT